MKILYLVLFFTLALLPSFAGECFRGEVLTCPLEQDKLQPLGLKCRIILVRHGETSWNVDGKKQGWKDIPLNEKGRQQARRLAKQLDLIEFKTLYASALSRALETAEIIAASHEGSVIVADPAVRFFRQDKIRFFDFLKSKKRKKDEMAQEITQDSTAYLKNLCMKHPGETVIVVTHARVIKYLLMAHGDYERDGVNIRNGSIVRFLGDGQTLSIEL